MATNELCFLAWLIWVTLFYFVLGGFDDEKAVIRTINRNSVVGQRHRVRGGEKACRSRDAGDVLYHRRGGRVPGEIVTQNLVTGQPKVINHVVNAFTYDVYYEDGPVICYGNYDNQEFRWSENPVGDDGIQAQPQGRSLCLKINTEGYQSIEVSMKLGLGDWEWKTDEDYVMQVYSNNVNEMIEWHPIMMECGKMQQIKMNLASDYVEDKGNKYNEVYFDLGGRPATYVSDIVVTGVPTPESGREYYYGDADGDRAITIADATAIQQQAVGLGEQYFEGFHNFHPFGYCDVNGDERLSILDVTCIQKYIAELASGTGRTGEKVFFDLPEEWYE